MARVDWPDQAKDELDQIIAYIREFSPVAATRIGARLFALGESLASSPHRGRPAAGGTRELVTVRPYILRYYVRDDVVTIVSIRHSARRPLKS